MFHPMIIWCIPVLNVMLSAWLASRAIRKKRLMSVYWLLATYFGLLLIRDMCVAPIVFGRGLFPAVVPAGRIAQLSLFVLLCNLSFLAGELIAFHLAAKPGPTLPSLARESAVGRHLFFFYAALFAVGCIVYLPRAYSMTYYDQVNNVNSGWGEVAFVLGWPAISIAALQKRYVLASIGVALCLGIVLTSLVRMYVLVSAVPMLLILLFSSRSQRNSDRFTTGTKFGVTVISLFLVMLGAYTIVLRTGSLELPEEGLPRGMYLICERVDHGIPGTGNASLETVAKALIYPFYNRFLTIDYNFPVDPPTYIADIMVARPVIGSGFRSYPFLWYTDAYLAGQWYGAFQGVVWGFIMALWEGTMAGRPVISAVFLPYFTLTLYMFFRGAGANMFHIVSRHLYFHVVVLLVGGLYLRWVSTQGSNDRKAVDYANKGSLHLRYPSRGH
jgi:hypothetical protein